MNEYHQIIYDIEMVKHFLEMFPLPKDNPHLCMCVNLFARKKYYSPLTKSEHLLSRIHLYGPLDENIRKILKVNVPIGCYISSNQRTNESVIIPDEALGLYINLRLKDSLAALGQLVSFSLGPNEKNRNPISHFNELVGKTDYQSKNNRKLIQIDFDTKDENLIQKSRELFRKTNILQNIVCEVETKNGFHIVYENNKEIDGKTLHEFQKENIIDVVNGSGNCIKAPFFTLTHQPHIVIPGSYQGGFKVKFSQRFS